MTARKWSAASGRERLGEPAGRHGAPPPVTRTGLAPPAWGGRRPRPGDAVIPWLFDHFDHCILQVVI